MPFQRKIFLAGLVFAFSVASTLCFAGPGFAWPSSPLKRGGVDVHQADGRFSLGLAVGAAGLDEFGTGRLALAVTPRIELRRAARSSLDLTIPIIWIPNPYPDPWNDPCPPDPGVPCPFGDLFVNVEAEALEVGPSIAVAPSLEWTFRTDCCLQPSVFLGAGLWHDRGRTSEISRRGLFTTEEQTVPMLSFGAAVRHPLGARTALRVEARAVTAFYDEMEVTAPGGSIAVLDGGSVTSGILTIGIELGF